MGRPDFRTRRWPRKANKCNNTFESKSKKGTEETIEYLDKEAKRDLNSEETKKLGEPEGQFEKIRMKRQPDGAIIL